MFFGQESLSVWIYPDALTCPIIFKTMFIDSDIHLSKMQFLFAHQPRASNLIAFQSTSTCNDID